MRSPRIAVFASGTGSNADALMEKMKTLGGKIEFVLSDKSTAPVLEKALRREVMTYVVEKTSDRHTHEREILNLIDRHQIDWVFLAGYMRLLSSSFLKELARRHEGQAQVVNIHPSLLPAYPGANSIERAFADKVTESGVTLHLVDEGMDTGPVLRQEKLTIHPFEALSDFKMHMHELEHRMYTDLLQAVMTKSIPTQFYQEKVKC